MDTTKYSTQRGKPSGTKIVFRNPQPGAKRVRDQFSRRPASLADRSLLANVIWVESGREGSGISLLERLAERSLLFAH